MQELKADTEIKVRIGSFVDISDGVTPESGILLSLADQAELFKHNSDSVVDISSATWQHITDCSGWYSLTLTASHTDTEGQLDVIVQDADICLPVIKSFMVLSQGAYNSKYNENNSNYIKVDMTAISGSTQTLQNFGYTYDGTGYTNDYAPAQQQQLANIANVGAAVNTTAENYTLVTGTQSVGTYSATHALDLSYHTIEDSANVTDFDYQFDVGKDGVPTSVTWHGYAQSNVDTYNVYASGSTGWSQIGSITGSPGTTRITDSWQLTTDHVSSDGKVRCRFYSTDGAALATDQILCSYAVVYRSVGYADGAVWIDTVNGTAGTTSYINGTADKPVNSISDAYTIANNLGLKRFHIINGSSLTLDRAYTNYSFRGDGRWSINLNNQDIRGFYVESANVIGSGFISASPTPSFKDCTFGNNSANVYLPRHRAIECSIYNPSYNICVSSGISIWDRCTSSVAGNETPTLQFRDQWVDFNCRGYMGDLTLDNMQSGDQASFDCPAGQLVIGATCSGGNIRRAGLNRLQDYSGGAVAITDGYGMTIDTDTNGYVWLSGVPQINVVQVSGANVSVEDFRADVSNIDSDIYFATIKYISDETNSKDEYSAYWFKNDQPVSSGSLTFPTISVYNTSNGSALFENQSMNYASPNLGVVRHDESTNVIASGEPYLVEVSGIIDGSVRSWRSIIGIDIL